MYVLCKIYDGIFPIKSTEFTKSLNFGSISRKKTEKKTIFFHFSPKIRFL